MTTLPQMDELIKFPSFDRKQVWQSLWLCPTIEHQFLDLRKTVQIGPEDIDRRTKLIQLFVDSIYRYSDWKLYVEGSVFGSSVNGLGFKDSDIDLILRVKTDDANSKIDKRRILRTIKNIGPKFLPGKYILINSKRCPIVKIECLDNKKNRNKQQRRGNFNFAKIDVSIADGKPLTIHNSKCIRFLCQLEPKFHLLAIVVRYWSKAQDLIIPGYMSSYAMVCMLILFCQTLEEPLLPSYDSMREKAEQRSFEFNGWDCSICMDSSSYKRSENKQKLSLLLLCFFEMYLNFNYASDFVNIRTGRCMSKSEFAGSPYYSGSFKFNDFLNIQDPFDLSHNLTAGMNEAYFRKFLIILRRSYSTLHNQLITCSLRPSVNSDWGLNSIFCRFKMDPDKSKANKKKEFVTKKKTDNKLETKTV